MRKFRLSFGKLIRFVDRTVYTAIFLLISLILIFIAKDYKNDEIYALKDYEKESIDDTVVFLYAKGQGKAENGTNKEYTIYVDDAGTVSKYRTFSRTVDGLLSENGIKIGKYDSVTPFGNAATADGMTVYVTRIDYKTETVRTAIPYETVINDVDTVMKDTTVTVTEGSDGLLTEVYRVKLVNGSETGERVLVSSSTVDPVTCVREHGTGGTFTAPDGTTYSYLYRRTCVATAYYDAYHRGKTATGHATVPGIVAVDAKVIPLHSTVYVCGKAGDFGKLKAEDVGNFRNNWIDIYFDTIEECYAFGKHKMEVYVLEVNSCKKKVHTPAATANIDYDGPNWKYKKSKENENGD